MKNDRILRKPEVLAKVALSDASVWRLEKQGRFPRRVKLGPQSVGWFESEVDEWMTERAEERG